MTDRKIGDEEYEELEEVNTSYDQNQPIGDVPQDYPAAGGEPIDVHTGDDFLNIDSHEALNKDGTGIKRATRGVNPNKAKHKVLKFIYVSNSECEICKPYDGKTFAIDSPNRPVIPRLESQGKKGGRPYTHPNCKCKWVNVFKENSANEFEMEDPEPFARARKMVDDKEEGSEGGRGSGKHGHQKWMLSAEAGVECENCMMITEYEDGKCMVCGN